MNPIQFLQQQFDKIYVLTIERMQERHMVLKETLQGINYELFFGLDKNNITLEEETQKGLYSNDQYLKYNKDGTEMRLGVYCCAYGHKMIYEDIVKNDVSTALILEDDVVLNKDALSNIETIFAQLPNTWELFYLGYEKNEVWNLKNKFKSFLYQLFPSHPLLKIQPQQYKKYYAHPLNQNIWKAGFHDCTHAYGITLQGAKKMIDLQTPIKFKSDTLLSFGVTTNLLEGYIAKPKLFNQLSIQNNSLFKSLVTEQ